MNPRQFLVVGGVILLALGIIGFLAPNPVGNTQLLQFDIYENYAHTILGIAALVFAIYLPDLGRWWVTLFVGIVALAFAIIGFAVSGTSFPNLGGANLENPVDNVIHLVVGIWGIGVAIFSRKSIMMTREERREEEMRRVA